MIRTLAFLFSGLLLASSAVFADVLEQYIVIINCDARNSELHITLPAVEMEQVFGTNADIVFTENGTLPYRQFQQLGGPEMVGDVVGKIKLRVAGNVADVTGNSLMVHPEDDPKPFQTPWDAQTASAICDADETGFPLTPASSLLYLSVFGEGLEASKAVQLSFPVTGRTERVFVVREFYKSTFIGQTTHSVPDGGHIEIAPVQPLTSEIVTQYAVYFSVALSVLCLGAAARFG